MSNKFEIRNPSEIHILEARQRQDLGDLSELRASIAAIGFINPIVIDEHNQLIAGERRLTCALDLGLSRIPVQLFSNLSRKEKHLIELEENVKRKELTWQEHVQAVAAYHAIQIEEDATWTEALTAEALGSSPTTVNRHLFVAKQMENPAIAEAQAFSVAFNAAKRQEERRSVDAKMTLNDTIDSMFDSTVKKVDLKTEENGEVRAAPKPLRSPILHMDFLRWKPAAADIRFNLLHCDFPYGIGTGDKIGQSAAKHSGTYDDSFETYETLLTYLLEDFQEKHIAESAHLIFWFSMKFYGWTKTKLENAGWSVNPVPLIWGKSDNRGILPDPQRSPRQITEFALFASRGDRKIVRAKANAYWGPTTRDTHTSEKPLAMLDHFFQMVVDENSIFLDPTCGSGNSVIAAHKLGARAIGLEVNKEFALNAAFNFTRNTTE